MARYRIGKQIGYGGMGVVHEGWKLLPDDGMLPVAIKRILPHHCHDRDFHDLLHREARVCLQVSHGHPNLVTVFDFDQTPDQGLFLVMEYVPGVTLEDLLTLDTIPSDAIRRIALEVLEALAYIHDLGVIHRDISPSNILLSRYGEVKLSDFGLAKVNDGRRSHFGFKGKTAYASPEAIQCDEVGPWSDLYSLAAVLYQLFTGTPPFGFGALAQINRRMLDWQFEPLPDHVPDDLRDTILGLLHYAPQDRVFRSAEEVIEKLDGSGHPVAHSSILIELLEQVSEPRQAGGGDHGSGRTILLEPQLQSDPQAVRAEANGGASCRGFPQVPRAVWMRRVVHATLSAALVLGMGTYLGFYYRAKVGPDPAPEHDSASQSMPEPDSGVSDPHAAKPGQTTRAVLPGTLAGERQSESPLVLETRPAPRVLTPRAMGSSSPIPPATARARASKTRSHVLTPPSDDSGSSTSSHELGIEPDAAPMTEQYLLDRKNIIPSREIPTNTRERSNYCEETSDRHELGTVDRCPVQPGAFSARAETQGL